MARYGRVTFSVSYVVDLDDAEMIDNAKDAITEDVSSVVRYGEAYAACDAMPDDTATEADIEEFLIEMRNGRVAE